MSLVFDCADPVERGEGLETAVDSIRRGPVTNTSGIRHAMIG